MSKIRTKTGRSVKKGLGVALGMTLLSSAGSASVVTYTDQTAWSNAVTGEVTYDFNSDTPGQLSIGENDFGDFSIHTEVNGVNRENPNYVRQGTFYLNIDRTNFLSLDVDLSDAVSFVSITFDSMIDSFAADWTSVANYGQLTATFGGETVSFVDHLPSSFGFLGFVSDVAFDTVTFGLGGTRDNEFFGLDNLSYANASGSVSVPEPTTFSLALLGLVGVSLLRRKPQV